LQHCCEIDKASTANSNVRRAGHKKIPHQHFSLAIVCHLAKQNSFFLGCFNFEAEIYP